MLDERQHPKNKSITLALIGKPNVGKSTLVNQLLGFDLSIVSAKPQTTRNQIQCIVHIDRTEVILVDTPGLHQASQELNRRMNHQAQMGGEGADLNLILLDASSPYLESELTDVVKLYDAKLNKSWILFTKSDLVEGKNIDFKAIFEKLQTILPQACGYYVISPKSGENIHQLIGSIVDIAPYSPHHYPGGECSNKSERFFATEYIREQAFKYLKEEVPYEVAVVIEEYKDVKTTQPESPIEAHISASILVNRPSQRAIVVGSKGSVIKSIGTEARKKIEAMIGGKVFLNLHVKVSPKWFSNNYVLDELGLPRSQKQARVWRKK